MSSGGSSIGSGRKSWDLNPGQQGFLPRGVQELRGGGRGLRRDLAVRGVDSGLAGFAQAPALLLLGRHLVAKDGYRPAAAKAAERRPPSDSSGGGHRLSDSEAPTSPLASTLSLNSFLGQLQADPPNSLVSPELDTRIYWVPLGPPLIGAN